MLHVLEPDLGQRDSSAFLTAVRHPSVITESMKSSSHDNGNHGYGTLMRYGNGSYTFHHDLYAHDQSRNPRMGDDLTVDFVNNVVYDAGSESGTAAAVTKARRA
jgi:hypothetical protein